jgi:hypothetical protein
VMTGRGVTTPSTDDIVIPSPILTMAFYRDISPSLASSFDDEAHPVKALLTTTAAIETGTGIALAVAPSSMVRVLLGSPLDSPAGLVIGRVLAAALFSLGAACWFARHEASGQMTVSLIAAMLLYNVATASLLSYALFGMGMSAVGLLPAIILHSALAVWCVYGLRAVHKRSLC